MGMHSHWYQHEHLCYEINFQTPTQKFWNAVDSEKKQFLNEQRISFKLILNLDLVIFKPFLFRRNHIVIQFSWISSLKIYAFLKLVQLNEPRKTASNDLSYNEEKSRLPFDSFELIHWEKPYFHRLTSLGTLSSWIKLQKHRFKCECVCYLHQHFAHLSNLQPCITRSQ